MLQIWVRHDPVKPTPVFDSLWRFAAERQEILYRRFYGYPQPWTTDPILQRHRFTNAYRAADRVSQYLIRNVIYDKQWSPRDLFFRILLFKTFNKIETWDALSAEFGEISYSTFRWDLFARSLQKVRAKRPIYSAAYIMASGATSYGYKSKHENHLAMLQQMIEQSLPERIADAPSLLQVFDLLQSYPTIGSFLAYQYAIDLNYSDLINFEEMSFVVPGPGAKDGISKCFQDNAGLSETDLIKWTTERQNVEFERLGLKFRRLGNRPLQLIDMQNLFCEISKYARVRHPEFKGSSGRTKIKQIFYPVSASLSLWFPPKWGMKDQVFEEDEVNSCHDDFFGPIR